MQAVPVHDLGFPSLVEDVDCDGLALRQPQQGTGGLAVVANRFHRAPGRQVNGDLADPERDVRRRLGSSLSILGRAASG
jgi:hypothetical protein